MRRLPGHLQDAGAVRADSVPEHRHVHPGGRRQLLVKNPDRRQETIVKGSEISVSSGDEGGTAGGGMKSNKIKGNGQYKKGSSKVFAEGKANCHVTSPLGLNGGSNANLPGVQVAPSQTAVTVMP